MRRFLVLSFLTLFMGASALALRAESSDAAPGTYAPGATCVFTPLSFNLSGVGTAGAMRQVAISEGDTFAQFIAPPITATAASNGFALVNNNFNGTVSGELTGTFALANLNGLLITNPEGLFTPPRGIELNDIVITGAGGTITAVMALDFVASPAQPYYPRTFNAYLHSTSTSGSYAPYRYEGAIIGGIMGTTGSSVTINGSVFGRLYTGGGTLNEVVLATRNVPPGRLTGFEAADMIAQFRRPDFAVGQMAAGHITPRSTFTGTTLGTLNGGFLLDHNTLAVDAGPNAGKGWLGGEFNFVDTGGDLLTGPWLTDLSSTAPNLSGYLFQVLGTGVYSDSLLFASVTGNFSSGGANFTGTMSGVYCDSSGLPTATVTSTTIASSTPDITSTSIVTSTSTPLATTTAIATFTSTTVPTSTATANITGSPTATATATNSTTPAGLSPSPTATVTAQPTCQGTWYTYEMQPDGLARGVSATTDGGVWAAGDEWGVPGVGGVGVELILRWNGSAWDKVPNSQFSYGGIFYDVLPIASNNVWAAGAELTRFYDSWPIVSHWDGTQWTEQRFDSPELESRFYGIDAVASNDIWAIGKYYQAGRYRPLIYHYNGAGWQQTTSPALPSDAGLLGVTAVAPNDVWAVGYTGATGAEASLIEHWNGTAWSVVTTPSVGRLRGADAISGDDIWAVGDNGILHWDGSAWSIVPSPSGALAVSGTSSADVWAVSAASVLHWDGVAWSAVTTLPADLTDVVAVAPGDVWVVGNVSNSGNVSFHYTNQRFIDVPPDNTFYSQVQCLACRGIISGYSDGTFRPNNEVTRGQLAKIVSNSAGFSESISGQTFSDVPPSNTFYVWIERLTRRGHMTGYVCGGPGEPCVNNMPYFRPFANATRGQTAKIVSNAAGFTEPASGQTFQDVPTTSTFYEFIQRLASRNVMQGYACGGPGEPCVGPENRPYFRPQNDVTRGQSAKIVANTFFPDCQTP